MILSVAQADLGRDVRVLRGGQSQDAFLGDDARVADCDGAVEGVELCAGVDDAPDAYCYRVRALEGCCVGDGRC